MTHRQPRIRSRPWLGKTLSQAGGGQVSVTATEGRLAAGGDITGCYCGRGRKGLGNDHDMKALGGVVGG